MDHHKKMSLEMRAKQFIPFAALTGFEEALIAKEKEHELNTINNKNLNKNKEIKNSLYNLLNNETKQLQLTIEDEKGLKNLICLSKEITINNDKVIINKFPFNLNQILQIKIIN